MGTPENVLKSHTPRRYNAFIVKGYFSFSHTAYLYGQNQNHDYFQVPSFGKLKTWKSVECNGLVYVWYHSEKVEPYWDPIKLPQIHNRDNENGKWIYRGRNEFEVIRSFMTMFIDSWR